MESILVVYKKSTFELYSASPDKKIREYMASNNENVQSMRRSHDAQKHTLDVVVSELVESGINHDVIYRADLETVVDRDLVVAVGGDGTLLEVSHYVHGIPVLGVNSDPVASVGFYSCADAENFGKMLHDMENLPRTVCNRLELELDGEKLPELVLNDVLIAHMVPAETMRYLLTAQGTKGAYKNDGLLVCAPAGSTAWVRNIGGSVMPLPSKLMQYGSRSGRREGFKFADALQIHSFTREGTIFIDGGHLRYPCGLGSELIIRPSVQSIEIVGDLEKKREKYL